MPMPKFKTVEEYLLSIPEHAIELSETLRHTIMQAAPKAEEVLSYNMPAYKQNGILVYWCVFKNHIGFFPTSKPIEVFAAELTKFKTSKGTIQFPLDKPIPKTLVKKILKYRMSEDAEKAKAKTKKK
jgi:uncharacterized protein YdhG (YjbR/CyaY superfamily)